MIASDKKLQSFQLDHRNSREFHLCGVGLYGPWSLDFIRLPEDENEFVLGDPWKIPEKIIEAAAPCRFRENYYEYPRNPCAYPMHERCWVLMTRILDVDLIKANMDLFVKAIRKRWNNERVFGLNGKFMEETKWETMRKEYRRKFQQNPSKHLNKYLIHLAKSMDCSHNSYALQGPLNIVEVRNVILEAEACQREQGKRAAADGEKKPSPITATRTSARRQMLRHSSSNFQADKIIVPPEVILLIMDQLQGHKEMQLLLWAFPHWRCIIPQSYWRLRCVKEFMLDPERIPAAQALEWSRVYCQIDRLFPRSHGLHNRRRIMKVLKGHKALFLKFVGERV